MKEGVRKMYWSGKVVRREKKRNCVRHCSRVNIFISFSDEVVVRCNSSLFFKPSFSFPFIRKEDGRDFIKTKSVSCSLLFFPFLIN